MKHSLKTGLSFGLTSATITTLGLIMGLHSGTHSKSVVIGGIITIAVADAFSDALGIHISEESENSHTPKEIWESTLATFFFKFVFSGSFILPIVLFELSAAVIVSVCWGLSLLGIFSFFIARSQNVAYWKVISEHLFIALVVIVLTHYVGHWVGNSFS